LKYFASTAAEGRRFLRTEDPVQQPAPADLSDDDT
jgi:hypothetical protein